jgi:hypothetical protein
MSRLPVSRLALAYQRLIDIEVKQRCEESLIGLTEYCWPILDPGQRLVRGWAMDAIADHLEATYYGNILRLVITVPPGFSKSSLTNVFFPLWVWLREAHQRFISASYEEGIPERDNLKCRNIVQHERWQRHWGARFKFTVPTTKDLLTNDKTGWKMATSVGGKLIGHRANYILIDDPNNPGVGHQSGLKRATATNWFRETVHTRLNDMAADKIILIQQRLHREDCAGVALSKEMAHENYVHLNIPMEYEPRPYVNGYRPGGTEIATFYDHEAEAVAPEDVFWRDPRTEKNQLAWSERFTRPVVEKLKKTLGRVMAAAQLQQRPVPRGGNIIKEEDWKIWTEEKWPPFTFFLATLDTAYTEDTQNDPSGLTIWGLAPDEHGNPRIMLLWAWTDWRELNPLVRLLLHVCTRDEYPGFTSAFGEDVQGLPRFPIDKLVIEGKASGLSVQQEIVRLVSQGQARSLAVDMLPAKLLRDDKYARLVSVSHLWSNGVIWAPDKEYADDVMDQIGSFPFAGHDEFVDCTTMALRWLRDCGYAPTREEVSEALTAEMTFQPKPKPLYGGVS